MQHVLVRWSASVAGVLALALALAGGVAHAQPAAAPALDALTYASASSLMAEQNRQIRIARRALEGAAADIRRADVAPNPTVYAQVSNTVARQYNAADSDRILRVDQTFERGGKRELRVGAARSAEYAARFDLADVVRQQRLALAQAYYDLVANQRLAAIAAENAAGYVRLVGAAERRASSGDLAPVDVARLRVEGGRAANDARAAEAAREQAQVALAAVLGAESQARRLRAVDDFPALAEVPAASLGPDEVARQTELAVGRRADARAALARVESLERSRRLAESLRTRDVTVGFYTEHAPQYGGNVFGVAASVPLFVNNDYSGEIARAIADVEQAGEDLERIRGAIRADVERAGSQLAAAHERARRVAGTSLPEARRAAEAIEFAFARGAATLTDLFDSRRQLAAVRAEAVTALADYAKALAAWREALAPEETP